jgi:hypothetical protein
MVAGLRAKTICSSIRIIIITITIIKICCGEENWVSDQQEYAI